ncbi:MAG TPA: hypothetical protein DER13_03740 [Clostridiales bacterium]|jgi:hypothetical protein|nr:hypothetical protein [Clostridia bacterium]HCF65346.1 hypothetical protein [Clostridiales bacterium]
MGKHLEEKSLIAVNENSLFYKIKSFFLKLFRGKKNALNGFSIIPVEKNEIQSDKRKDDFIESIRNVENEQTKLLKLQEQFDNRKIEKSQLSKEQIADLTALYKKQINDLEQSNERRINKIRQNKNGASFLKDIQTTENEETKLLKLQQKYDKRLIETNDLPKSQIKALINLYKKQISEITKSNERRKQKLLQYRKKLQTDN